MTRNLFIMILISVFAQSAVQPVFAEDTPTLAPDSPPLESTVDRITDDGTPPLPPYDTAQASTALGFRVAINKFPVQTAIGSTYQIFGEYLLPWQSIGVISLGAHAGIFPLITPDHSIDSPTMSNLVAGVQASYQLKFWNTQPIIPIFSVEWDYMRIKARNYSETQIQITTIGGTFGVLISLNPFDSVTIRDAYETMGMTKGYFSAQFEPVTLTTPNTTVEGGFWFWGVRLEFE